MTTLTSPHDLLAAVPFLIGYHPKDSLVLISLRDDTIGLAMRVDYPKELDSTQIKKLAQHLLREQSDAVLIVAYVPADLVNGEFLLAPLMKEIDSHGLILRECLEVKNEHWKSLLCYDLTCCPVEGNPLPKMEESRVVAEQIVKGHRLPFNSVETLKESLSSFKTDPELAKLVRKISPINYDAPDFRNEQRLGALAVSDLLSDYTTTGYSENKALLALVLVRMQDLQVRDFAMGITNSENIETLATMWHHILRIAPKGYIAPAATLFASVSYENGDGAMAQRALDRAFEDDLGYPLAKLLRRVFAAGWPPSSFTAMRAELHPKICACLFGE
jgi:hypothetical protein